MRYLHGSAASNLAGRCLLALIFGTLVSLTLTSCGSTEKPVEEISSASWSDLLPYGFTDKKSRTDQRVVSKGFAYNVFSSSSYECPKGFKRCAKASVISEKGCPKGIFAVLVLEDEYGNEAPGTILSEPNTSNILPNERTVLDFNITGVFPDALPMFNRIQMFNIGCND